MGNEDRAVVVTGASGFLGRAVCKRLLSAGYRVRALVRSPDSATRLFPSGSADVFRCNLPAIIPEDAFAGAYALIHCAWANRPEDLPLSKETNIEGSQQLFRLAKQHGLAQIVFVSSVSAHEHAESAYGKTKLLIENSPEIDAVVRPGLIIGPGGLFKRMNDSIGRLPLVPLFFGGSQRLQFIHVEDLCCAIQTILDDRLTGQFNVAHPESVSVRSFYSTLGEIAGRRVRFVRLPGKASLGILKIIESIGIRNLPVSSENLLGLKNMCLAETLNDLEQLNLNPRNLKACLTSLV
jgi:nucleoside-diphosphate-sugar epimerase